MSADYTLWKPKIKEKFLLWSGEWNDILNLKDCQLQKLTVTKDFIIDKLYCYFDNLVPDSYIIALAQRIIDFCGDDEIVLTNDCGKEYFSDEDIFYGIKDTYKIVGER